MRQVRHVMPALTLAIVGLFVTVPLMAHDHDGTPHDRPIWTWTPEQIVKHVSTVRAGRDLTPEEWPEGNRVAVSFSFDVDTEPVWIGFQEQSSPSYMSRGEYGARAGMPRVMKLLAKHDIPASFFIPAMSMELHPEVVSAIKTNPRNEFGFHSYVHENPMRLTAAEERSIYAQAMEITRAHTFVSRTASG